ncbi:unnamed protein product [Clonostachys byssicola]|uniref:Uncharacterized protein n=1 Tax=Clonostachys byssicola TaxID=160290 RepID=A0A9N9Y1S7_9HYPO|nr:unnamed protein product [Clonostachys byssicola]
MRTSTFTALLGLGLLPLGLAQSSSSVNPGPSPTNSVGCEPHGDHWHCEGPATQTGAVTSATGSASVTASHNHDHDDDHSSGTASLKPSPTNSVGCEPHGDHWHCTGPATGAASVTTPSTAHTDAAGTGSLKPSPTESVGCEPHGDHWHCDGPATTAAVSGSGTSTGAASSSTQGGMAAAEFVPLAGAFAAVAFAL